MAWLAGWFTRKPAGQEVKRRSRHSRGRLFMLRQGHRGRSQGQCCFVRWTCFLASRLHKSLLKRDYQRMSPTAEQLIRDYLNQVSVAARTRLRSEERRAFLARMRDSIELHCGARGSANPGEVAEVLANLGDPHQLVELEAARLKNNRGDSGTRFRGPAPRLGPAQGRAQRRDSAGNPRPGLSSGLASATGAPAPRRRAVGPAAGFKPGSALAGDRPLTGEIKVQHRPMTSRWRPGEPMQPRQPRPKQPKLPKQPKPPRQSAPSQPRQTRLRLVPRSRKGDEDLAATSGATGLEAGAPGQAGLAAISGPGTVAGLQAGPGWVAGAQAGPGSAAGPQAGAWTVSGPQGDLGTPSRLHEGRGTASGWQSEPAAAGLRGTSSSAALAAEGGWPGEGPGRKSGGAGPPDRLGDDHPSDGGFSLDPVPLPAGLLTREPRAGSQAAAMVAGFAQASAALWRRHPLEGTAVLLLLLAALVYPFPFGVLGFLLWVAGILTTLPSKLWDTRDKWLGLAVPVVAAVAGVAIALADGGQRNSFGPYAHEVAMTGPPMLAVAVALGAIYLAWRVRRGPRSPAVPPWNRPHRI
jgi:hypothetical protein